MSTQLDGRRILVAGASGGTGRHLLRELASTGAHVRALTRSPATAARLAGNPGVSETLVGDVVNDHDCAKAVAGMDAVLCAVGPATNPRSLFFGDLVDKQGSPRLIRAAAAAGVAHFVYTSTIGVGDSKHGMGAPDRVFLRRSLAAKEHAEDILRTTPMTYTILRPGRLTDDPPTNDVLICTGGGTTTGKISRADVAHLMMTALVTAAARNATFEIVDRARARGHVHSANVTWNGDQ
jgi:nucleoside-diphosphate-sugar epimerase